MTENRFLDRPTLDLAMSVRRPRALSLQRVWNNDMSSRFAHAVIETPRLLARRHSTVDRSARHSRIVRRLLTCPVGFAVHGARVMASGERARTCLDARTPTATRAASAWRDRVADRTERSLHSGSAEAVPLCSSRTDRLLLARTLRIEDVGSEARAPLSSERQTSDTRAILSPCTSANFVRQFACSRFAGRCLPHEDALQ